jgi:hypothetical protein
MDEQQVGNVVSLWGPETFFSLTLPDFETS